MIFGIKNPIGVPVDLPSKIPESNCTLSSSFLELVTLLCPGFLLSKSFWIISLSISNPAGQPSIIPPIIEPCDSPKDVSLNNFPKVFPIIKY